MSNFAFSKKLGVGLVSLWCLFTFVVVGWILLASLSTTKAIFSNTLFSGGFHPENYVAALFKHNVAKYFLNSIVYTLSSIAGIVLVSAPAAYVLSRFEFRGNRLLRNLFVTALGIPAIMIIMPLFSAITSLRMTNSRGVLIFLYICINVPFTVFFLISFFRNLSFTFEEAAAIDGCGPMKTFWIIMLPLAQPGIVTVSIFNFITVWNVMILRRTGKTLIWDRSCTSACPASKRIGPVICIRTTSPSFSTWWTARAKSPSKIPHILSAPTIWY